MRQSLFTNHYLLGIMLMQHPVRYTMGYQLNRAGVVGGTAIHHFDHLSGKLGMPVIVKSLVNAGHRLNIAGDHHQIMTDDDNRDGFIQLF